MDVSSMLGMIGTVGGIVAVIFSLVSASRNNARWGGIIDHKLNNVIDGVGKIENRLMKLENDRSSDRQELVTIAAEVKNLKSSVNRAHDRIDKINGGRDRDLER